MTSRWPSPTGWPTSSSATNSRFRCRNDADASHALPGMNASCFGTTAAAPDNTDRAAA